MKDFTYFRQPISTVTVAEFDWLYATFDRWTWTYSYHHEHGYIFGFMYKSDASLFALKWLS